MKKTVFIVSLSLFSVSDSLAQNSAVVGQNGYRHAVSGGINVPIGTFSESHIAGISSSYSWSHHRFGYLQARPRKLVGFTADGGIDYYLGKSITEAGYDFTYGNYLYLHTFGGIICNPGKKNRQKGYLCKTNIRLTAGPAMGIYKGNADVGYGIKLSGSYYLTEKLAITPGMMFMKHTLASSLGTAMISTTYNF